MSNQNFTFPLTGGKLATFHAPHPMSEEDFAIMLGIFEAMKAGMIEQPTTTQDIEEEPKSEFDKPCSACGEICGNFRSPDGYCESCYNMESPDKEDES